MSPEGQESASASSPRGPGALALVVGASGVGKDALLAGARAILDSDRRFVFPERMITRPPHASEKHVPLSEEAFTRIAKEGGFALAWAAHGLSYAIPASIDENIRQGQTVVVNGSRAIAGLARQRYARACLILVECPLALRAERLALRRRESAASVEARLLRKVADFDPSEADIRIDNSSTLAEGVDALVATLLRLSTRPEASGRG